MTCPCCGATTIVPAWEYAIGLLSPSERRAVKAIIRRPGMGGSELADAIYADRADGGPDGAEATARAITSKASAKLKPHGFVVRGHKSYGYRVVKVGA